MRIVCGSRWEVKNYLPKEKVVQTLIEKYWRGKRQEIYENTGGLNELKEMSWISSDETLKECQWFEIACSSSFKRAGKRMLRGMWDGNKVLRRVELFKNNPFEPKLRHINYRKLKKLWALAEYDWSNFSLPVKTSICRYGSPRKCIDRSSYILDLPPANTRQTIITSFRIV